jgi:hypothetical protein
MILISSDPRHSHLESQPSLHLEVQMFTLFHLLQSGPTAPGVSTFAKACRVVEKSNSIIWRIIEGVEAAYPTDCGIAHRLVAPHFTAWRSRRPARISRSSVEKISRINGRSDLMGQTVPESEHRSGIMGGKLFRFQISRSFKLLF